MAKYVHTHPKDLKASDARGEGRSSGQHHGTRKIESCQVEPAQGKVTISSNYSKSGYRRKIQSINLTIIYSYKKIEIKIEFTFTFKIYIQFPKY